MTEQLTIKDRLSGESFKGEIAKALPKHLTPDRFIRVALTALNRTPKLQQCTQVSLFKCLLDCSSLGIEPDGRRAYLIPYGKECTLIISYMGLIELCKRNGDISNVYAALVRERDFFDYSLGTDPKIIHRPVLKDGGDVIGAYAVVSFKDESFDFEYMSIDEIHAIRDKSQGYSYAVKNRKPNPWIDHSGEMEKKTPIRRLLKRQTLSPEIREQIENEDSYETQSYQQRAANAKPADTGGFELPDVNPLDQTEEPKKAHTPNAVEDIQPDPVEEEPEETQEESNKAEYEESIRKEQREGGF